ncbi:MAG: signal peptidase I [Myxococcota bacterium]
MDLRKLGNFLLWTTILVGLVAGALRLFLVRTWTIPADDPALASAIEPTLSAGDVVLVLHAGNPGFGELVRCTDPDEPRRWVVGRIVGEGGDTVEIRGPNVIVNGRKAPTETACAPAQIKIPHPNTGEPVDARCDMEDLGASLHMRAYGGQDPYGRDRAPIKRSVQPGFFFLLSDNRNHRFDSTTYGAVPVETCDARIIFRLWSAKGFGDAEERFEWIN